MGRRRKEDQLYSKKRDDGRSYFYWRARWVDGEGRKRTKRLATGVVDDGTPEARRNAVVIGHRLQAPLAAGGERAARNAPTLKQAVAKLLKDKALSGRRDATLAIITEKAAQLFAFFGPNRRLDDISDEQIEQYAHHASETRKAATLYREMLVLKQAYKATRTKLPSFPELPRLPEGRGRILEIGEQVALLNTIKPRWRLHVLAMLQLGIRRSEMWKLGHTDWEARTIIVHGTKTRRANNRLVPIPRTLYAAIEQVKDTWPVLEPWPKADRRLKKAAERAGIEPICCNDLRRTYATFMARAGESPLTLARYMGTSVKMLEQVYARIEKPGEHHARAVDRGVPVLPMPGAHSVLENASPAAKATQNPVQEMSERAEMIDVFQSDGPAIH